MTAIPKPTPRRLEPKRVPIDTRPLKFAKKHYDRDARFQAFVRQGRCEIAGRLDHVCYRVPGRGVVIEFGHCGIDKGVGVKCADRWGIALCHSAHAEQHTIGWKRFEKKYGIDRLKIAAQNWETYSRLSGKEPR